MIFAKHSIAWGHKKEADWGCTCRWEPLRLGNWNCIDTLWGYEV